MQHSMQHVVQLLGPCVYVNKSQVTAKAFAAPWHNVQWHANSSHFHNPHAAVA